MSKFKIGDTITAIDKGTGFNEAVVLGTFISDEKRTKDMEMYLLKIMNGIAIIPVSSEVNYKLCR